MKKLFAIRDTKTNKLVEGMYFDAKPKAKNARDTMNQEDGGNRFVVTYGPDHWKFSAK